MDWKIEVINLQGVVNGLLLENAELKRKIIELEDKLNINSTNSGLPTSKEIYRKEKYTRPKSDRKPGGQVGHRCNRYQEKPADKVVEVAPNDTICSCGGALVLEEEYRTRQKIEIPPIKPIVTEYRLRQKVCCLCNKKHRAKLDSYKLLGKNATAIIGSLGGFFNNSKREIQEILKQIFNLDLSLGLISKSEGRISSQLKDKYEELLDVAQTSTHLHLDETSCSNKGKKGWAWVGANKEVTVFKLANSRGTHALEGFLPGYEGKVISDRYGVYNKFENKDRQICLAHLRRDFKRFAHSRDEGLSRVGLDLLSMMDALFRCYKSHRAGEIRIERYLVVMGKIRSGLLYYLKTVEAIDRSKQAQRVAKNILKSFDMMWRFLEDPEIEPTNNFAERQIKHFVKYRKNSLFTWSDRGDRFLERIKSLYASAKLQNINPWNQLSAQLS